jgi:hypothetical protein
MANLTIALDEETLRNAELRATQEGSTVDKLVRDYLESYAGAGNEQLAALQDLLELAKTAKSGHSGRRWTRDELYDRVNRRG